MNMKPFLNVISIETVLQSDNRICQCSSFSTRLRSTAKELLTRLTTYNTAATAKKHLKIAKCVQDRAVAAPYICSRRMITLTREWVTSVVGFRSLDLLLLVPAGAEGQRTGHEGERTNLDPPDSLFRH